jgi:carbon-monoxide dehydrogenase catalytic subunit
MIGKARADGVDTCFSRVTTQRVACNFGRQGLCCRICHMGPCRLSSKAPRGVCGADADTIVARNFLREIAAGTAAHSDHSRHLVLLLKSVAAGKSLDYALKDVPALRRAAQAYDLPDAAIAEPRELAAALAEVFLAEFTAQEDEARTLSLAPPKRLAIWRKLGIAPKGVDRTVVEALHRSHIGVDHAYENVLMHGFRTALADGWVGSRVASIVSDILFGTPSPVKSRANLGVLKKDTVNVLVHGHEPALSEMLAAAVRDPELVAAAKAAGASGITIAGICCTANEVLMRHGIPVAGNFLQQELAIVTGAVELMVTDIQCVMPSLPTVAAAYHTEIVSTSDIARTVGATHAPFDPKRGMECARELLRRAIANFSRRDAFKVAIPDVTSPLVAGFSVEAIKHMLGGAFRGSFRPLNDAIIQGRIRGVAGVVGCNNPHSKLELYINALTRELVARDVLVLKTGCAALASAKSGMLAPEAAAFAGPGLREVCEAVGLPPVLHMGSCVDNARILEAATEIVLEGGLGDDLSRIPAVGVAPEWMSEKAIAIGC